MKKIISFVIAVTLLLSSALSSWTVFAEEVEENYSKLYESDIKDNDINYSFENGVLTVSGTGYADNKYQGICKKSDVKEVVIKSGVKGICDYAFANCKNLSKVTIPKSVTQLGYDSFSNTNLSKVTIPSTVEKIGNFSFWGCKNLKKVTMPGKFSFVTDDDDESYKSNVFDKVDKIYLNSSLSVKNIGTFKANKIYTFKNDKKYKSYKGVVYTKNGKKLVMVPYRTKNLKIRKGCKTISMNALLYSYDLESDYVPYCQQLMEITIPATVKYIKDDLTFDFPDFSVLQKCKWNIKSKKLNGRAIENLLKMVGDKTKKKILTSSQFKVKKTNGMYITKDHVLVSYEGKAKNVSIPKDVVRIGDSVFYENKYLKKLVISNKVKEIGKLAFYGCRKLSSIKWGKKIKSVGAMAFEFIAVKNVKLPKSVKSWGKYCFANSKVQTVKFSKTMKEIPYAMFSDARLTKVTIPGNIKVVGRSAFAENDKLKEVIIKEGVEKIEDWSFDMCGSMDVVTIPNSVKNIEKYAFSVCDIKKLVLKNKNTVIGNGSFYGLKSIACEFEPKDYIGYMEQLSSNSAEKTFEIYIVKVEGASGFEISFANKSDFSDEEIRTAKNETKIVIFNLPSGEYNYYRIRPYTNVDGKKVYGQWREYNW